MKVLPRFIGAVVSNEGDLAVLVYVEPDDMQGVYEQILAQNMGWA